MIPVWANESFSPQEHTLISFSHGPGLREPAFTTDQHTEPQLGRSYRKMSLRV